MTTTTTPPDAYPYAESDRVFDAKVCQYVADPGFDGTVRQYLATMVEEYSGQTTLYSTSTAASADPMHYTERAIKLARARYMHDAYADALRVLDAAIDAAAQYATEHPEG